MTKRQSTTRTAFLIGFRSPFRSYRCGVRYSVDLAWHQFDRATGKSYQCVGFSTNDSNGFGIRLWQVR